MKLIFSIVLMCSISYASNAQANLVFNQVKNISGTYTNGQTINNVIVPTGKVLKIESATCGSGSLNTAVSMLVGNHIIFSGYTFYGQANLFPLWLGEGSYPFQINCTGVTFYSISGIEFNVVP